MNNSAIKIEDLKDKIIYLNIDSRQDGINLSAPAGAGQGELIIKEFEVKECLNKGEQCHLVLANTVSKLHNTNLKILFVFESEVFIYSCPSHNNISVNLIRHKNSNTDYIQITSHENEAQDLADKMLYTLNGTVYKTAYREIKFWIDEKDIPLRVVLSSDFSDVLFDENGKELTHVIKNVFIDKISDEFPGIFELLTPSGSALIDIKTGQNLTDCEYSSFNLILPEDFELWHASADECAECFNKETEDIQGAFVIAEPKSQSSTTNDLFILHNNGTVKNISSKIFKTLGILGGKFVWDDEHDSPIFKNVIGLKATQTADAINVIGCDGNPISDKLFVDCGLDKDVFEYYYDCGSLYPVQYIDNGKYNFFYSATRSLIFDTEDALDDVIKIDYNDSFIGDISLIPVKRNGKCNFMFRDMFSDETAFEICRSNKEWGGPFMFHENSHHYEDGWVDDIMIDECMFDSGFKAFVVLKDNNKYLFANGKFAPFPTKVGDGIVNYAGFGVMGTNEFSEYANNCVVIAETVNGKEKYSIYDISLIPSRWRDDYEAPLIVKDVDKIYNPGDCYPLIKKGNKYNYIDVEHSKLLFDEWFDDAEYSEYLSDYHTFRMRVKRGNETFDLDEYGNEIDYDDK